MSSYLTFYLKPKEYKKKLVYDENDCCTEKEVKLSNGEPLHLISYARSSDIYQAYYKELHPAYVGVNEEYTELTYEDSKNVCNAFELEIKQTEKRLEVDYKMLKESGYAPELYEEIQSFETYLAEQRSTLQELKFISSLVYEISLGYNDFEKVLINVD